MSVNKVMLVGRLGQDPDVRYMPNETAVCNFSLATSRRYKNKDGERVENTEWHRVVMFGKLAEIAKEYVKKGSQIYIEGRLQTRKWQTKEGQDRYTTEIIAENMTMLGGKSDSAEGSNQSSNDSEFSQDKKQSKEAMPESATPSKNPFDALGDDDIPF